MTTEQQAAQAIAEAEVRRLREQRDRDTADLARVVDRAYRAEARIQRAHRVVDLIEEQCDLDVICEAHGVDIYDGECALVHDLRAALTDPKDHDTTGTKEHH